MYLRRGLDKDIIAQKWLRERSHRALACIRSVLRTYAVALGQILRAESWWLKAEHRARVNSKAFESAPRALCVGDCFSVETESSNVSEIVGQQLYSAYYKKPCGKFIVTCSPIGGTTCVGPGLGGP